MAYINLINSYLSYNESTLCLNNHSLDEYTKNFATPFYLYDLSIFEKNYQSFIAAAQQVGIKEFLTCYAIKSNDHSNFLSSVKNLGSGADVVSIGELRKCLKSKIAPENIVFSGVGKTDDEINAALVETNGKLKCINVESLDELASIISISELSKKEINICLRLNPASPGDTHEHISTGGTDHKFGLLEFEINQALKISKKSKFVNCIGLSMHIGSQLTSLEETKGALKTMNEYFQSYPYLKIMNIGGGLGIHYDPTSNSLCSLEDYMEMVSSFINTNKLQSKEIIFEPGRFLSGNTGVLITKVIRQKRFFRIVDAGMNDMLRPALYDAHHEIYPLKKPASPNNKEELTIAGPICETGDFFINKKSCYPVIKGDFLAISNVGAYGKVLSSTYNSRSLIKEYFI
jgi:diaminopimelate decarboxylase